MTLVTGDLIEQARAEHVSFTTQLAPVSICTRFVNEGQRRLMKRIHAVEPTYLARPWVIKLLPNQNVAQVGAGTGGEAPLEVGTTTLNRRPVNTGAAALTDIDTTAILVPERAVSGASATTLATTGVTWTVDDWQGQAVQLLSGTGAGQVRQIANNSASAIDIDPDTPWGIIPDTTTTFCVRDLLSVVDGDYGALLSSQPNTEEKSTFLVRLDAAGLPYLDLSAPVTVALSLGIPLPPSQGTLDGFVFFRDQARYPNGTMPLTLTPYNARLAPPRSYCASIMGQQLYLSAPFEQWGQVDHIELPYIPNPPAISAAEDFVFLPDDAEDALVAAVILGMSRRAAQLGTAGPDIASVRDRAETAEADYLELVTGVGRVLTDSIDEVW